MKNNRGFCNRVLSSNLKAPQQDFQEFQNSIIFQIKKIRKIFITGSTLDFQKCASFYLMWHKKVIPLALRLFLKLNLSTNVKT